MQAILLCIGCLVPRRDMRFIGPVWSNRCPRGAQWVVAPVGRKLPLVRLRRHCGRVDTCLLLLARHRPHHVLVSVRSSFRSQGRTFLHRHAQTFSWLTTQAMSTSGHLYATVAPTDRAERRGGVRGSRSVTRLA